MTWDKDVISSNASPRLFVGNGPHEGALAVYQAFGRAAELQDRGDALGATAWLALGKAILAALWSRSGPVRECLHFIASLPAFSDPQAPSEEANLYGQLSLTALALVLEIRQQAQHISRELSVLFDGGYKGGSIAAESVHWFTETLSREMRKLQGDIDRLLSLATLPGFPDHDPSPNT